jgi:hypothetical protein
MLAAVEYVYMRGTRPFGQVQDNGGHLDNIS